MKSKRKKEKPKKRKTEGLHLVVVIAIAILIIFSNPVLADPTGPSTVNITANETKGDTSSYKVNISGGYIATLNVTATVQNDNWKAFVGDIDGRFTLDDSSGSTIYDWSLASISGEIYATRNSSDIDWTGIGCATQSEVEAEDTYLEHTGTDNINTTFNKENNSLTFVVAGTSILTSTCYATNTYVDNETQQTEFEEVILYDDASIVYATVLEDDEGGFDGNTYDFQMIVPENASETWDSSIAYYLYVELSS